MSGMIKKRFALLTFFIIFMLFSTQTVSASFQKKDYSTEYDYSFASSITYNYEFYNIKAIILGISDVYYLRYDKNDDEKYNVIDVCLSKRQCINALLGQSEPYNVNGIDVSKWQGTIDWAKVKSSGISFAIIRAGYGRYTHQEDVNFRTNIENAQNVGIDCGVYWYSYATTPEDAILEANTCLEVIKGYNLEYPVWFDIEEPSQKALGKEKVSEIIRAFCSTIESAGYYTGIYSYRNFIRDYIEDDILDNYDIWIAHWASNVEYEGEYEMWQYTSKGSVNGIEGNVDLNICYKNYPKLMKEYNLNGY